MQRPPVPGSAYACFSVGPGHYALDLLHVHSVAPLERWRSVPDAPSIVLGLTSCRGSILNVIDTACLFGFEPISDPSYVLRLAEPHAEIGLALAGPVRIDVTKLPDHQRVRLLDHETLVQRIEGATTLSSCGTGEG